MKKLYRIHWKVYNTGATGYGRKKFSYKEAKEYSKALNKSYTLCHHWVEGCDKQRNTVRDMLVIVFVIVIIMFSILLVISKVNFCQSVSTTLLELLLCLG